MDSRNGKSDGDVVFDYSGVFNQFLFFKFWIDIGDIFVSPQGIISTGPRFVLHLTLVDSAKINCISRISFVTLLLRFFYISKTDLSFSADFFLSGKFLYSDNLLHHFTALHPMILSLFLHMRLLLLLQKRKKRKT